LPDPFGALGPVAGSSAAPVGGFDPRGLQPGVALFGDRPTLLFARRGFQRRGQAWPPAVLAQTLMVLL